MANIFDQFDDHAVGSAGNIFDQFDEAPVPSVAERFPSTSAQNPALAAGLEARAASMRPGALEQVLKPLTSYPETYAQMNREARDAMSTGASAAMNPNASLGQRAMGGVLAGLGGVSYAGAPINAALRTFLGNPIQEGVGVPRDYTEFAAGLMLPGVGASKAAKPVEKAVAPTVKQLKDSYVAAKSSPVVEAVEVAPQAAARQADVMMAELSNKKFSATRAPQTFDLLSELRGAPLAQLPDAPGVKMTMANIDDYRYQLGLIAGGQGPDAEAARLAKKSLDEWIPNISRSDVIAGSPAEAQAVMQAGRQDYTAAKLAEALDKRVAKAELQTGATHSGMNLQNQLRQKAVQFLNSSDSNALTAVERQIVEGFVKGTLPQNALRFLGKKLGNVFTTGSLGTGGALLGGPAGAVAGMSIAGAGYGMQKLSNVLTARQATQLSELLRSRSPLGQQMRASIGSWEKYAKLAEDKPMTPRIIAMLTIQSRNLANNLKDAGIVVNPEDLARGVPPDEPSTDR